MNKISFWSAVFLRLFTVILKP